MYFGSGIWKAFNPKWQTGEMIRSTYLGDWHTPQSLWFASFDWPLWFYSGLILGVIVFELCLGVLLYIKSVRGYAICFGILFHLANWFFLNIPGFMLFPVCYVLFLDPATVERGGYLIVEKLRLNRRTKLLVFLRTHLKGKTA